MKSLRGVLLTTFLVAMILVSVSFVFAETNAEIIVGGLAKWIQSLFEGASPLAIANLSRILLGILVWMVLYSVVKEIGIFYESGPIWTGIVAAIITILSFILIPSELIQAIMVPYSALGATIATMLPFLIMIYFTIFVTDSLFIARTIWVVFIIYYFSIVGYKLLDALLKDITITKTGVWFTDVWNVAKGKEILPYFIALAIGIVIFLMLRRLRHWVTEGKIQSMKEQAAKNIDEAGAGLKLWGKALEAAAGKRRHGGFIHGGGI